MTTTSACWNTTFVPNAAAGTTPSLLNPGETYYWRVKAMNDVTSSANLVTFTAPRSLSIKNPTCVQVSSNGNSWYACDGVRITQIASSVSGDAITDFEVQDGYATWRLLQGGLSTGSYAYYSSSVLTSSIDRITQVARLTSSIPSTSDSITEFAVDNGRATWRYLENGLSNGSYAYYTSPVVNPSSTRITQFASLSTAIPDDNVTDFTVYDNYATWRFTEGFSGSYAYYYRCFAGAIVTVTQFAGSGASITNFSVSNDVASWTFNNGSSAIVHTRSLASCQ
jgi:hypothetical protein